MRIISIIKTWGKEKGLLSKTQASRDILAILQEADKMLLAKNPVVAHSCLRLAITELKVAS